jgi:hypothetical protein
MEADRLTNAEKILLTVDRHLTTPVDITLYGRAAITLGYPGLLIGQEQSLDVDAVLWNGQAEFLLRETDFWAALEAANHDMETSGLYMSHLFDESQVILTPDWRQHRVVIPGEWRRLSVSRLGDGDLLLSKMMREDALDLTDAQLIIRAAGFGEADVLHWIDRARVPDSAEVQDAFGKVSKRILSTLR